MPKLYMLNALFNIIVIISNKLNQTWLVSSCHTLILGPGKVIIIWQSNNGGKLEGEGDLG